ncbi:MAG: Ig-like domain-containing protein, partial [Gemmatimonadaceae bacterium]
ATGIVTTVAVGSSNITAVSGGITGIAAYQVVIPPVASAAITLPRPALYTAQTTLAVVVLRDPLNRVLTGRVITFASSDLTVATVSAAGLVTGVNPGNATITATSEGISATATVAVTLIPVSTVQLTVPQSALQIGQTTQAAVVLKDVNGVTLTGRTVTWASSNTALATVSGTGFITALAAGNAIVTATSEGVSATVAIDVTLIPVSSISVAINKPLIYIGYTAQVTSTPRDVNNNVLTGRLTTWLSSDANVATVSAAGVVTAIAKGTATITGTSEGISAGTQVTVDLAPVQFVTVAVPVTQLLVGQSVQATVATSDINDRPLTGRVITYQSSNTSIATVDKAGAVTATGAGSVNIIASSEGKSGFVTIQVQNAPVATVSVSLGNTSSISVGGAVQALVTLRDANNKMLTGRFVQWTSGDPAIVLVDNNGLVTGIGPGTTTIIASSEGKSGQVNITVTFAPVASVTVSISPQSIFPLQAAQATVVLRDVNNNLLTGRQVSWQSSNGLVATVNSSGAITGLFPGTTTITATSEGISGAADVNVSFIPVSTVDVSLSNNTVVAGTKTQATVVTRDFAGNVLSGRVVSWSSSNAAVAMVDANGLVTSVGAGTADIIATSEGKTGFATITVTAPPPVRVATVKVSLTLSSVVVGATSQASAVTLDASNNVLSGRVVAWSTSDAAIATVNANGLVTTIGDGVVNIMATSEGIVGSASLTVTLVPVANVAVTLKSTKVKVGNTTQATATATDARGSKITGRAVIWASSDTKRATVSTGGVVSAVAQGSAIISATIDGQRGTATVTVP